MGQLGLISIRIMDYTVFTTALVDIALSVFVLLKCQQLNLAHFNSTGLRENLLDTPNVDFQRVLLGSIQFKN